MSEFDRTLLYTLVLVLTGSAAARVGDLAMLLRITAAAFAAMTVAGLLTRLAPATFPISAGFLPERIAFPLTYWNAMGIACALAILFAVHLSASAREPRVLRVVAAALLPAFGVTLYLTFSRGAIWALPVGLVLYALLGQPRGLLTAAIAAIPAAIAVKVAYGADLLARADYDTAAAAPQARHVGLTVIACCVAAGVLRAGGLWVDARVERVRLPERARLLFAGGVIAVLVVGALAVGAPQKLNDARKTFSQGSYLSTSDLRDRLTSTVDNGRVDNWRVALDGFDDSWLHGTGAGTYRLTWELDRPAPPVKMNDGHSLYLETLSELGVPGLLLVVLALGTLLVGGLLRLAGPERHAYAMFVAGGAMLCLHAGVDWDWEMPALFVWLFGAGGVALAARAGAPRRKPVAAAVAAEPVVVARRRAGAIRTPEEVAATAPVARLRPGAAPLKRTQDETSVPAPADEPRARREAASSPLRQRPRPRAQTAPASRGAARAAAARRGAARETAARRGAARRTAARRRAAATGDQAGRFGEMGRTARLVAALAVLLVAVTPALMAVSQLSINQATDAWAVRDCPTAIDAALTATERLGVRPEPWRILGYCDARLGQYELARRAMDAARARDPHNWQLAYGQAIVYGVSGKDALPYAREAVALNPLDPFARKLLRGLEDAKTAAARRQVAGQAQIPTS